MRPGINRRMRTLTHFFQATGVDYVPFSCACGLLCGLFLILSTAVDAAPEVPTSPTKPLTSDVNTSQKINDVRVLIDISGSMKRNDPGNLRRPALQLFVSLLPVETPATTHSGVWTFGQWVNMLIPHGPVTQQWKTNAQAATEKINSTGLYTNIEDVLRRSTWDWKKSAPHFERTLILLTDGLVDISREENTNVESRQRILNELLPQLQQAKVTIHAIALSKESDQNLLKQLTTATGGRFETIETTQGLERLFLHLFEDAAPTDTLPLTNNRVKVDNSIKEMTFLVFREDKKFQSSITSPEGKSYNSKELKAEMTWHKEAHYDLVTVKSPEPGFWTINAPTDPDNRVMVVTNLKLKTSKIPPNLLINKKLTLHAHLEENGDRITQRDFLHFVKATINQSAVDSDYKDKTWKIKLRDNGKGEDKKAKDGIYTAILEKSLIAGEHEIEIAINGTTFRRHSRQQLIIYSAPATANIEKITEEPSKDHQQDGSVERSKKSVTKNAGNRFRITVFPYQTLINSDTLKVLATHKLPNGDIEEYNIPRTNPAEWQLDIPTHKMKGKHEVTVNVSGNAINGDDFNTDLPVLKIKMGKSPKESTHDDSSDDHSHKEEAHDNLENSESADGQVSLIMVSVKVFIFNIFLFLSAFLFYRYRFTIKQMVLPNLIGEASHG